MMQLVVSDISAASHENEPLGCCEKCFWCRCSLMNHMVPGWWC